MSTDLSLTLCMITKNDTTELDLLKKCLDSVKNQVQNINITVTIAKEDDIIVDELRKTLVSYNCIISTFVWTKNFSDARNFNLFQSPTELVMWLDTDDVVIGSEFIPKLLKRFSENQNVTSIWMQYHYDHDKDGNCILNLPRERIFKKSIHEWKGRLHENAICKFRYLGFMANEEEIYIKHNTTFFNIADKAKRNFEIIKEAYLDEKKRNKIDPRTVYDLARSFEAIGKLQEASDYFSEFLKCTDSEMDYYDALMRICNIYLLAGITNKTRDAAWLGIKTNHEWPDAYIVLAQCAYFEKSWEECIFWLDIAKNLEVPIGVANDPLKYTVRTAKIREDALFRLNRAEESQKVVKEALEICPSDKQLKNSYDRNIAYLNRIALEKGLLLCLDYLKEKEPDKVSTFIDSFPETAKDLPAYIKEYYLLHPIKAKNRLIIYCGDTIEKWGYDSIETGIGGSEEAVINMAEQLSKLGWNVEVYNTCSKRGTFNGVEWKHYYEYNYRLPADVFIVWRMNEYVALAPEGSLKILWLHDKQKLEYYAPGVIDKIDKIFFLSKYHRKDLPEIPDNKIYITKNGINPDHFPGNAIGLPNTYIYASSPDRGLEHILKNWMRIKEINRDAELHIFYGFTEVYDKLSKNDPARRKFKEDIMDMINTLPNIVYHGKVGHKELADWFLKCKYWLYPTHFPEISCITAIKAQAAGCIPICTDYAALNETVQFGCKVAGNANQKRVLNKWLDAVADVHNHKKEINCMDMRNWAIQTYSWEYIANDWSEKFKAWKEEKHDNTKK